MNNLKKMFLCGTAALILSGCSSNTIVNAENAAKNDMKTAETFRDISEKPMTEVKNSPVSIKQGAWLGSAVIVSENGTPFPTHLERPGIAIRSNTPMNIWEIATEITNITRIPVNLDVETMKDLETQAEASKNSSAPIASGSIPGAAAPVFDSTGASTISRGGASGVRNNSPVRSDDLILMDVNWKGSLSGLLDLISSRYNYSWEYDGSTINIFKYKTETFSIAAMPTATSIKSTMDSGTAGPGSGNGSGEQTSSKVDSLQSAKSEFEIKIWNEISDTIKKAVGDKGTFSISPSLGTVTVTASKQVLKHIKSYIDNQNAMLGKQVAISVKVLSVKTSVSDAFGFNPKVFFAPLAANPVFKFTYGGGYNPITGAGNLAWGILSPNSNSGASRWTDGSGNATNAAIETLSKEGNVSVVTSTSVTTLNNVPSPVQIAAQKAYMKEMAVTTDGNGNTTTAMTPGSVTTGFNMHVLPRIDNTNSIQLQYGLSISELLSLTEYVSPSGDSSVQLPEVEARSFTQQAFLKSGATLVLAGYERISNNSDKKGNFDKNMIFPFGGTNSGEQTKNVMVILMTPVVLDRNGQVADSL